MTMGPEASSSLCVVGGGAAAAAVLVAWAAHPRSRARRLVWVAPAGEDGRGLAYQTLDPAHRLNVRAGRMSMRADQPGDFVDFLATRDAQVDPQGFYPRCDYGDYLHARVAWACSQREVIRIAQVALAAAPSSCGWRIRTPNADIETTHLILAIGPQPARLLPGIDPLVLDNGRYQPRPYAWSGRPADDRTIQAIWIIGSGLTAVDMVLTASRRHPQASIHLLSRHAALPAVHDPQGDPTPDLLGGDLNLPPLPELLRRVRTPRYAGEDWRLRVDSLRTLTADRWQRWSLSERRRFLRHLRWAWDCARHRMAPEAYRALQQLKASGRLHLHAGRLAGVRADAGGASVEWTVRGTGIAQTDAADLVIQATGLNTGVRACNDPLLRSLIDNGAARADDLDMGLAVDAQQRLLRADGGAHRNAHVLGAMARGSRFECIAMPEIRVHAAAMVAAALDAPSS